MTKDEKTIEDLKHRVASLELQVEAQRETLEALLGCVRFVAPNDGDDRTSFQKKFLAAASSQRRASFLVHGERPALEVVR